MEITISLWDLVPIVGLAVMVGAGMVACVDEALNRRDHRISQGPVPGVRPLGPPPPPTATAQESKMLKRICRRFAELLKVIFTPLTDEELRLGGDNGPPPPIELRPDPPPAPPPPPRPQPLEVRVRLENE